MFWTHTINHVIRIHVTEYVNNFKADMEYSNSNENAQTQVSLQQDIRRPSVVDGRTPQGQKGNIKAYIFVFLSS